MVGDTIFPYTSDKSGLRGAPEGNEQGEGGQKEGAEYPVEGRGRLPASARAAAEMQDQGARFRLFGGGCFSRITAVRAAPGELSGRAFTSAARTAHT